MAGLTDQAGGIEGGAGVAIERAHQAWVESMERQLDVLRAEVKERHPGRLASNSGGQLVAQSHAPGAGAGSEIRLSYWGQQIAISCEDYTARNMKDGKECSVYDMGMLLYYLREADGTPLADEWIGYRQLPGGSFYSQAFQGYTGDRLAKVYGEQPEAFMKAAEILDGVRLTGLPGVAYAFLPLPRTRLAAILYPGDEEFAARASVLFDASASHYMTTDGLALLGAGLAGRLVRAGKK